MIALELVGVFALGVVLAGRMPPSSASRAVALTAVRFQAVGAGGTAS
ncbi:MAG: hypothetical protein ACM3QY_03400 [Candidatus Levyibacteriota bacterium]